jgi:geranylgeranyl diphosphate synthase type II
MARTGTRTNVYLAVIVALATLVVYLGAQLHQVRRATRQVRRAARQVRAAMRSSVPRPEPLRALSAGALLAPRTYAEYRGEVDGLVARALAQGEFGTAGPIEKTCAHALRGGKRLRSIIALEIGRAAACVATNATNAPGGTNATDPPVDAAEAALAIEYLHTASLIIDDLPEFDDDDERRGRPAAHRVTSPAVAQMSAVALVSAAFQNICRQVDWIRESCPRFENVDRLGTRLCFDVAYALGGDGAVGGQCLDSVVAEAEILARAGEAGVLDVLQLKTATFFEIAFLSGWLVAGGSSAGGEAVQRAGRHFGIAFQVADDMGDMAQDAARRAAGKPGLNYANLCGLEAAEDVVARNLDNCMQILDDHQLLTPLWGEVVDKVWGMAEA